MKADETLRVVFMATGWSSAHGGVATFNRDLAKAVARQPGTDVWCLLPWPPSPEEIDDARRADVWLRYAEPQAVWAGSELFLLTGPMLAPDHATGHAAKDPFTMGVDAVVGHGRWTGPAAQRLAGEHKVPARAHVVHVDPYYLERYKVGRELPAGERADRNLATERRLCTGAVVFGVGPRIAQRYLRDVENFEAHELLPGFSSDPLPRPGSPRHVLVMGRLEDADLKGVGVAMRCLIRLAASDRIELELRGARNEAATQAQVDEFLKREGGGLARERLKASVKPFSTDQTVIDHSFRRSSIVMMPSLDEGFGLVGVEALARQRPVLVSCHSGLGDLIRQECGTTHADLAKRFLIDPDDIDHVVERLDSFFTDMNTARAQARELRQLLASRCDWDGTAQEFVRILRAASSGGPGAGSEGDTHPPEVPAATTDVAQPQQGLETWPRTIRGEWIERPEESELWAALQQEENGLVLLLGAPGSGKSALLSSIATRLRDQGAGVVTLKADQIPADVRTEAELCRWMGLDGSTVAQVLERLQSESDEAVLVIDQMDALASLVDLHTGRLRLVLEVLTKACSTPGVRVVASVRDLESRYDPSLRQLRAGSEGTRPKEIRLGRLPDEGVRELWSKTTDQILETVPAHLGRPHILKLAVKLGQPLSSSSAVTESYWRERVASAPHEAQVALFGLAEVLENEEAFWVAPGEELRNSLDQWLGLDGLLLETDEEPARVGFSHQILFEEAQAQRWLDEEGLEFLVHWVEQRLDTLTYRPKLRAILERVRTSRVRDYAGTWRALWDLGAERRNLRELLVVHLGQSESPTPAEAELMRKVLMGQDHELRGIAVGTIAGRSRWFAALRRWISGIVAEDDTGWLVGYLSSLWEVAPDQIDEWLRRWAMIPHRRRDALWVLSRRETWSDSGFDLLLRLVKLRVDDDWVHHIAHRMKRAEAGNRLLRLAITYGLECWGSPTAEDPYEVPSGFPWDDAASVDPLAFVSALVAPLGVVAQVAAKDNGSGRRFGFDPHAWKSGRRFATETPLAAFRRALPQAIAASGGDLTFLDTLEAVDNEEMQKMLLTAYAANAADITEHALGFLLSDVRRILVGRAGADLVASLGPHLSEAQRDKLLIAIDQVTTVADSEEVDPEYLLRLRSRRARLRAVLHAMADGTDELDVAQTDLLESLDPHIRGGFVGSPHSVAELTAMSDQEVVASILFYEGRDTDWSSGDPVGGERELGRALEEWASRQPERALSILDEVFALVESRADQPPQYRTALMSSLRGLTNAESLSAAEVEPRLVRFLRAGLFDGQDSTAKEVRWEAASQLVPWMSAQAQGLPEELYSALLKWAALDAQEHEEEAEVPTDGKPLLEHVGLRVMPRGSYPALRALAMVHVRDGQVEWDRLLGSFEELVRVTDARSWRTLLGETTWRPTAEFKHRWFSFIDDLFSAHPSILAHRDGAHVARSLMWTAPAALMEKWLDSVRVSNWKFSERFATEMETLMVAVDSHMTWAEPKLEQRLAGLESETWAPLSEQQRQGVGLGLAFLWSHTDVRARVSDWAERFVARAPRPQASEFLGAIRFAPAEPVSSLLELIRQADRRELDWPEIDRAAHSIGEALVTLSQTHVEEVADASDWLLGHELRGRGGLEELTIIALHLTRQPEPELQRRGLQIFEGVLATGGWFARRALDLVDGQGTVR